MPDTYKRTILLIDDDTSLLVTLRDFLTFENYNVVTAESGEEGLKRLETITPDLIILDMSMPGMGGIGFLKEIRLPDGRLKHPVLVLTARADMAEFFADVEVDGFIAKPCEPHDLLMEIGRIVFLRSGAGEDETAALPHQKARVLVGEDDPALGERIARALSEADCIVESADRGPDVVEKAIIGKPDLIIMKLVLEGMNGDAVAGILKEMGNTKNVPIILYDSTGAAMTEARLSHLNPLIKRLVRSDDVTQLVAAAQDALAG